ncbi:MAG: hypothetical protein IIT53_12120 [Fibrobacter sp.]|nr:hypothetical protein [Fibrobacter sp.]
MAERRRNSNFTVVKGRGASSPQNDVIITELRLVMGPIYCGDAIPKTIQDPSGQVEVGTPSFILEGDSTPYTGVAKLNQKFSVSVIIHVKKGFALAKTTKVYVDDILYRHPTTVDHYASEKNAKIPRCKIELPDIGVLPAPGQHVATLTVYSDNLRYGDVFPSGTWMYETGITAYFYPRPREGYSFIEWESYNKTTKKRKIVERKKGCGNRLSAYVGRDDMEYCAIFRQLFLTVKSNNDDYGSVTPAGRQPCEKGTQITLKAVPKEGYYFYCWTITQSAYGRKSSRITTDKIRAVKTITMADTNMECVAVFRENESCSCPCK